MQLKAVHQIQGVTKVLKGADKGKTKGTVIAHPGDIFETDQAERLLKIGAAVKLTLKNEAEELPEDDLDDLDDLGLGDESEKPKKAGRKAK